MSIKTADDDIYISFNQTNNYSCFGTSIGFYIYQINPFNKVLSRKIDGGISLVKMLNESNIILFVGRTDRGMYPNNKLIIWDDQKKNVLGEISYNNKIKNIDLTKNHIVVLCDKKIYIYNFESLTLIKSIDINTDSNLMSLGVENSEYLIYPGDEIGSVTLIKLDEDYCKTIKAHSSKIEHLHLSKDGKFFVTASEKGTIFRIYSVADMSLYKELRRGMDATTINDIRLSDDNSILLASSIKGTIHLYNTGISKKLEEKNTRFEAYGTGALKNLLPSLVVPEYFNSEWSFCQVYLSNVISYSVIDKANNKIYSFGNDGQFYEINYENSSKPKVEKTIKYISDESDPFSERSTTIK